METIASGRTTPGTGWCSVLAVLLAVALTASCVRRADLTPAPTARRTGTEAAVSSVDGVAIEARSGAWRGLDAVLDHVTPVRIKLTNDGTLPVRLGYSDFALIAPDGRRYAALPPFEITGAAEELRLARHYAPVNRPLFVHHRFNIATYHATLYPHLAPVGGTYFHDPLYDSAYYRYWEAIPLPTRGMLEWALPEGVIRPGGHVMGFLYFERVEPDEPGVVLRADLVTDEGKRFGEARIPFDVEPARSGTARRKESANPQERRSKWTQS